MHIVYIVNVLTFTFLRESITHHNVVELESTLYDD